MFHSSAKIVIIAGVTIWSTKYTFIDIKCEYVKYTNYSNILTTFKKRVDITHQDETNNITFSIDQEDIVIDKLCPRGQLLSSFKELLSSYFSSGMVDQIFVRSRKFACDRIRSKLGKLLRLWSIVSWFRGT